MQCNYSVKSKRLSSDILSKGVGVGVGRGEEKGGAGWLTCLHEYSL